MRILLIQEIFTYSGNLAH